MDFRNVLFLLLISLLLFGTACAQKTVNDFQVDESYSSAYNGTYHSLYLNEKQDSGMAIYKNVVRDADDDNENDEAHDDLIHDEGKEYLTPDDDIIIDKNSDSTFNFTDYDHAEHGVGEVVECDGEEFIVVFWAKDISYVDSGDLMSQLKEFNEDNDVKAIEF